MVKFELRVDSSFYGSSGVVDESAVGVGFEVYDVSNGNRELVCSESIGRVVEVRDSTEAELFGVKQGVERVLEECSGESAVVLEVVCDCDSALESLANDECGYVVGDEVVSMVDELYSVSWTVVDRSEMWDVDDAARRAQRRVRNQENIQR